MSKIAVIVETGGAAMAANTFFFVNTKINGIYQVSHYYFSDVPINPISPPRFYTMPTIFPSGIGFRLSGSLSEGASAAKTVFVFNGNFNYDSITINTRDFTRSRIEVRNEYGVLIADNGIPWVDGTYPPDAKNRAGLAGLHAAPEVINPELETALMGDETDKERVQE